MTKEKILEILCGKKEDDIGKNCKRMFAETADQILELLQTARQQAIKDFLASDEGKVYQDYQELRKRVIHR